MSSVVTPASGTKTYEIADRVIASTLPLVELRPAQGTAPAEWRVTMPSGPAPVINRPFHYWNSGNGQRWATFGRDGSALLLRFARTATFAVDNRTREIRCYPIGRARPDALRLVLLNQLLPLLFGCERLVLHASAVATPAGAVAFVGRPGAGKSTIAAALARRGFPLIADDFLIIEQAAVIPHAIPSKVEPRLWPDSVTALLGGGRFPAVRRRSRKRRISPAAVAGVALADARTPIHQIYVLPATDAEAVGRLKPQSALAALIACAFIAHVDQPGAARTAFDRVTTLVRQVPVRQLAWLRDFDALHAFCDAFAVDSGCHDAAD